MAEVAWFENALGGFPLTRPATPAVMGFPDVDGAPDPAILVCSTD